MRANFRKSFARDLKQVKDQTVLERVQEAIEQVEAAVNLAGIGNLKKLTGTSHDYRIRVGKYRLGVVIAGDSIEFVRCLPRRDLYRYFP